MRQIRRYDVAIGNEVEILCNYPLKVANGDYGVEFWTEYDSARPVTQPKKFCIFGTGHPIPDHWQWVDTAPRTASGLVWHLYVYIEGSDDGMATCCENEAGCAPCEPQA